MRVIVIAVGGGGKSTTLQLVQRKMADVRVVNFGDYMFNLAREAYGVKDRDEMRRLLSLKDYRGLQEKAAVEIARLSGDIVIDTHTSVKSSFGYYPGLPSNIVKLLKPDAIVLLEYDPQVVMKRRGMDLEIAESEVTEVGTIRAPRLKREVEGPEEIELHQQMNRYFAVAAAHEARCYVKVINLRYPESKPFEHAVKGAEEVITLIKSLRAFQLV